MSLILDALHRSRQDTGPVPGLGTHHPVAQIPVERRHLLVWIILGVALVVIAWLLMERFSAPPAADIGAPVAELSNNVGSAVTAITTELKSRAESSVPTPAPASAVTQPVPPTPAPPTPAPPTAVAEPAAQVAAPQASVPGAAPAAATPALSAQESDAVAELYRNRELQKDPVKPKPKTAPRAQSRSADEGARNATVDASVAASARKDADLDKILHQAREELENSSLPDNPTPFLSSLSQQTKDDIPTIYYQRHDYSTDPNQSSVVLNGATVKAGGSPLPGMKVEEILPDSVVLNYRGTQFRLRALNSWINL